MTFKNPFSLSAVLTSDVSLRISLPQGLSSLMSRASRLSLCSTECGGSQLDIMMSKDESGLEPVR